MTDEELTQAILDAEAQCDEAIAKVRRRGGAFEAHPELVYYDGTVEAAMKLRDQTIEAAERAFYESIGVDLGG